MALRLDYDTAARADPFDAWATLTVIASAAVLSVFHLRGARLDALVADGAVMPGEPWRLLSSTLLHGSWTHLLLNLWWTFRFGVFLEAMFGTARFAAVMVCLGLGASAAEWAVGGPAIGLSGIGYGCFGLLFALDRWHPRCRGVLDRQVTELFAAWFAFCIAATHYGWMPVANVAHGAGAVLGGLLGWTLAATRGRRLARGAATAGALLATLALALTPLRGVVNRSDAYALERFLESYAPLEAEDWPRAAAVLEEVTARVDWSEAWFNLGVCYQRLARTEDADAAFARAEVAPKRFEDLAKNASD